MEGPEVYRRHTAKEGGARAFWQKGPPEIGIEGNVGGSQHGREAGKRRAVPRRRLGWRHSGTYPLSLAAPPWPALPPLHVPILSPKPPRDPATLSSSPLSPSPGTWRPRRSIVFASWGAEEFGLIGSTEFTEVS